jgi:putative aldouronate transport system substrate-binding protein
MAAFLVMMLVVTMGLAAAGASQTASASAPVEVRYFSENGSRNWKDGNPTVLKFEEKFNIKFIPDFVTREQYSQKAPLLIASGDLPDMMKLEGYQHFDYISNDVFLQLDDLIAKVGPNITKHVPQAAWDMTRYQGKTYALPSPNYPGKFTRSVRQDWLDKLKLPMPKTLDDFYQMARAITLNDPDGNGRADTYGVGTEGDSRQQGFMDIFGAYGGVAEYHILEKDGRVLTFDISENYREALRYIKRLYDEKLLDPEAFINKQDQSLQKIVQNRIGSYIGWWSSVPVTLYETYKVRQTDPKVNWAIMPPLVGPNGQSGMQKRQLITYTVVLSKKTKAAEPIMRFMDYLISDEGQWLAFLGIEGEHWYQKDGMKLRTEAGAKAFNEMWLDVFGQTFLRADLIFPWYGQDDPLKREYIEKTNEFGVYGDTFEGISTAEYQKFNPELRKYANESFIRFVMGELSLDRDWNSYVTEWKRKGGDEVRNSLLKAYNTLRGTSLTFKN